MHTLLVRLCQPCAAHQSQGSALCRCTFMRSGLFICRMLWGVSGQPEKLSQGFAVDKKWVFSGKYPSGKHPRALSSHCWLGLEGEVVHGVGQNLPQTPGGAEGTAQAGLCHAEIPLTESPILARSIHPSIHPTGAGPWLPAPPGPVLPA